MKANIKSPVLADRIKAIDDAKRRVYIGNFVSEIKQLSTNTRIIEALARVYAELRLMNDVEDKSMLTA